ENSVIAYNLPAVSEVSISIFDISGHLVHEVFQGEQGAGRHILPVALNVALAEGTYFVRFELNNGEFATTRKLISLH
ncbi:MAG TPA: T9SS type A sorting domain-containing protein, partial [Bacteroidetes bacterium]|nr:T9SS type A sorting domain-containing protein [Bacteroidota bacterium]